MGEELSRDRGRLRWKQLGDLRTLAQEVQTSTQLTPKVSLPLVPRRGLWKVLDICALGRASKPASSAFLAASTGLSDAVTRQTRGPPQSCVVRTITRPKHLRFLLGIGKLLSDRIPSFPAQADFFIYHRTHSLVYVLHRQAFLPRRFYSTNFSYICSLQDCR